MATINDQIGTIMVLRKYCSDVNTCDKYGNTPLHCAVNAGALDIVVILIGGGADTKAKDTYGHTPLSITEYECNAQEDPRRKKRYVKIYIKFQK